MTSSAPPGSRFTSTSTRPAERVAVELQDLDGNPLSTLSASEALQIAGRRETSTKATRSRANVNVGRFRNWLEQHHQGSSHQQSITSTGGLTSTSTLTNSGAGGQLQITGLGSAASTRPADPGRARRAGTAADQHAGHDHQPSEREHHAQRDPDHASERLTRRLRSRRARRCSSSRRPSTSSNTNLVTAATTANLGAVIGSTTTRGHAARRRLTGDARGQPRHRKHHHSGRRHALGHRRLWHRRDDRHRHRLLADPDRQRHQRLEHARRLRLGPQRSTRAVLAHHRDRQHDHRVATRTGTSARSARRTARTLRSTSTAARRRRYSASDTVTNAIPGVTLTLDGVTPDGAPVTITTGPPAPNTQAIITAVQQFVSDYNNAVSGVEGVINTAPASESNSSEASPYTDNLFGDPELENLLEQHAHRPCTPAAPGFRPAWPRWRTSASPPAPRPGACSRARWRAADRSTRRR